MGDVVGDFVGDFVGDIVGDGVDGFLTVLLVDPVFPFVFAVPVGGAVGFGAFDGDVVGLAVLETVGDLVGEIEGVKLGGVEPVGACATLRNALFRDSKLTDPKPVAGSHPFVA